jgi:multiple sugar transport system substrate-binding protein
MILVPKANIRKTIIYMLIVFASLFSSCVKKKSAQVELSFWAMGAEGEHINYLISKFETTHPGIKVKVQSIPWGAAHEKLLTAFAGQSFPDICQLGNTWVSEFQAIGALLALDSLIVRSAIINKDNYFEGIWNTNVIGRSVFGIPWYVDTRLLFYRTDILTRVGYEIPPQTWEEWLDVSRKIKQLWGSDQKRYAVFFPLTFNAWQIPVILIMENGGRLLKDNNSYGAFDDPATIEALKFYLKFFKEELSPRNMTEVTNIYHGFADAFFSMMITGPWNVSEMRKRASQITGLWTTSPMPRKKNRNSVAGGSSLVISQNAREPEAAWKFIEFLSTPKNQVEFFRLTRDLPAVREAWNASEIQADREIKAFYFQLEDAVPTPKIAEWEQIAIKLQEHLERVAFDRITIEEAVVQLNKEVDRILEKRRWLISRNLLLTGE